MHTAFQATGNFANGNVFRLVSPTAYQLTKEQSMASFRNYASLDDITTGGNSKLTTIKILNVSGRRVARKPDL